jgi:predicted nucleic acid-binding protein
LSHDIAAGLISTWTRFPVQEITLSIFFGALEIKASHGFSCWDSAIFAADRALGGGTLYSEGSSHGREVEGITIINWFG